MEDVVTEPEDWRAEMALPNDHLRAQLAALRKGRRPAGTASDYTGSCAEAAARRSSR